MTPEVEAAVEEIRETFAGHQVDVESEEQGGAYVTVHDLEIGECHRPSRSWIGFLISFQYPRADIYPHFVDANVQRTDGKPHGGGIQREKTWRGRPAHQVSRRSKQWNHDTDTAVVKLLKVLEWLRLL